MPDDLTVLQLAEQIAHAVLTAAHPQGSVPYGDAPTQAVLRVLHETNSWLVRIVEDEHGITQEQVLPGQMELFAQPEGPGSEQ